MDADDARPPLLAGRGLLLVDDFCRATGLDRATAEGLVKKATVEGLFYPDGRVAGFFDDALPTTEVLRDLGLAVKADYDPEQLRSYEEETDTPGVPDYTEDEGSSDSGWTMGWDDRRSPKGPGLDTGEDRRTIIQAGTTPLPDPDHRQNADPRV